MIRATEPSFSAMLKPPERSTCALVTKSPAWAGMAKAVASTSPSAALVGEIMSFLHCYGLVSGPLVTAVGRGRGARGSNSVLVWTVQPHAVKRMRRNSLLRTVYSHAHAERH